MAPVLNRAVVWLFFWESLRLQDAMTVPSAEELDSFKYSDLQNLAKRLGLQANPRAERLLRTLTAHLNPKTRKENENQDEKQSSASSIDETDVHVSREEHAETESGGHAWVF